MKKSEKQTRLAGETVEHLQTMAQQGFDFLRGQKRERAQVAEDPLSPYLTPKLLTVSKIDLGGEPTYAGGRRKFTVEGLQIQTGHVWGIGGAALYLSRRERRISMTLAGRGAGEFFMLSSSGTAARGVARSGPDATTRAATPNQSPEQGEELAKQLAIAGLVAAGIEAGFEYDIGSERAAELFHQWGDHVDLPHNQGGLLYWTSAVTGNGVRRSF